MSFLVIGSSNERPIRRLMAKNVRSGLVTPWRLAGWPTSRSPSSVNATIEGVGRDPSEFSMTLGVAPSMTATQEFVVPRSMPITLVKLSIPVCFARQQGPEAARPWRNRLWLEPASGDSPVPDAQFQTPQARLVQPELRRRDSSSPNLLRLRVYK